MTSNSSRKIILLSLLVRATNQKFSKLRISEEEINDRNGPRGISRTLNYPKVEYTFFQARFQFYCFLKNIYQSPTPNISAYHINIKLLKLRFSHYQDLYNIYIFLRKHSDCLSYSTCSTKTSMFEQRNKFLCIFLQRIYSRLFPFSVYSACVSFW